MSAFEPRLKESHAISGSSDSLSKESFEESAFVSFRSSCNRASEVAADFRFRTFLVLDLKYQKQYESCVYETFKYAMERFRQVYTTIMNHDR